jgi:two-component system sensor kinase FixL
VETLDQSGMLPLTEAQSHLLLEHLGEAVFMLDPRGRVESWTPAAQRVFGHRPSEILGSSAAALYESDGPDELAGFMESAKKTGRSETDTWRLRRDGSRFWAHEVMCPLPEGGGFAVIVRDLSELMKKELILADYTRALELSNRELEEFASIASHDLQEPLRKILSYGDRLQTHCADTLDAKGADYLGRIVGTAVRMRELIDALLSYSRIAANSGPPRLVDLGRVARAVVDDMEGVIERSGARVELGELPRIMAEPTQIRQLLQNLISNALKFRDPARAPVVSLSSRSLGEDAAGRPAWEISVQDNGIGFDEKYLGTIFGMLERLHGREEYEGTGMGLAICRRVAERHGGGITAQSRPGEGARFIVSLSTPILVETRIP